MYFPNRRKPLTTLTIIELWYILLISLAILVAGNSKAFLERYGFIGSPEAIRDSVSDSIHNSLTVLDSFKLTPELITFVFWGLCGLVFFSVGYAIAHALKTIRHHHRIASHEYIHPSHSSASAYGKQIIADTVRLSIQLVVLAATLGLYTSVVVPASIVYVRRFVIDASTAHVVDLAIGLGATIACTALVWALCKITFRHYYRSIRHY